MGVGVRGEGEEVSQSDREGSISQSETTSQSDTSEASGSNSSKIEEAFQLMGGFGRLQKFSFISNTLA